MKQKLLPLNAKAELLDKMVNDLNFYAERGQKEVPGTQSFTFLSAEEDRSIVRSARGAALKELATPGKSMVKQAFDTRRTDQATERNARANLQSWHRSEPFISEEDSKKMNTFAKLAKVMVQVKKDMGMEQEWHESYARQLHDNVTRILRVKQADMDIAQPQLNYLEQLMYARYRLTMSDLENMEEKSLREAVLEKDESLLKRGKFLEQTGGFNSYGAPSEQNKIVVDGNGSGGSTQEALINAIFGGGSQFRKDGEQTVERTITITVRDSVVE